MKPGFYIGRTTETDIAEVRTSVYFNTRKAAEAMIADLKSHHPNNNYFVAKIGTGLVIHEIDGEFYIFNMYHELYFTYKYDNRDVAVRVMNNLLVDHKTDTQNYCERHYTIASPN